MNSQADNTLSLEGYPNLSAAAKMLGVSRSTLSRREDIASEHRGERDLVMPVAEVLRLARIYRKRSINDVAQGLLEHAEAADPESRARIEAEIEAHFAKHSTSGEQAQLLELARRLLPPDALAAVEASLDQVAPPLSPEIVGLPPVGED
jgi:hypothetical protein